MFRWITANPVWAGVIALVAIAAVVGFFGYLDKSRESHDEGVFNSGVQTERGRSNEEVINNVREANDARDNPTSADLNVLCEKYDRNCPNRQ